ncbi:hypothetical protein X777_04751 [Ooceraea biroi]|uniref:Uncharacterized protein n=1 Tax=Ooceraea biroi TaxID=2015173 RepID=A0A026WHB3_OOCBI|nr:hypothetical protein X777_04751 [Ooceraea biroi]
MVKTIATRNHGLLPTSDLREWYDKHVMEIILSSPDEFQERDSGWALSKILNLTVNVNKYNPMRVGCVIDIPRAIQAKRAVVNVRAEDNACFAWAVIAALYSSARHADRKAQYPDFTSVLDVSVIEFPMTLDQIGRVERGDDVSINVFAEDEDGKRAAIVPLRLTDRKRDRHVNLLYVPDGHAGKPGHFTWIRDISRLVSAQLSRKQHQKYRVRTNYWSSFRQSILLVEIANIAS